MRRKSRGGALKGAHLRALVELAEVTGVPARTTRFYMALWVAAAAAGRRAAACDGEQHLKGLNRLNRLQGHGWTLAQIAWQLGEGQKEVRPPEPSAWWSYPVSKDVVVEVRCDSSPWRLKQVRSLIAQMIRQLNENEEKDHAR